MATIGANLAHGLGHRPIGALVSAWPALALIGAFELLMTLIRIRQPDCTVDDQQEPLSDAPLLEQDAPTALAAAPTLEQLVRARHQAGHSQRAIARELNVDRRKVKRIVEDAA